MTPGEREEAIRQARRADEALEFVPFEAARSMIIKEWCEAKTPDAREALHSELHALARVLSRVQAAIMTGKMALAEKQAEQE